MKNKPKIKNDFQSNAGAGLTGDAIFLAVLSGLLLFLSFPKYGFGFIAWIALIPLFFALKKAKTFAQGLLLGFITGAVGYIGIIYWITFVIVNYGYLPLYAGIILMLLLACYLGAYISLFAGCIIYFRERIPLCLTAPVLWICLEYVKSVLLTGFPWENLGYSQYSNTYFIQIADIAGIYGISFLIILTNAAIFEVISKRSAKEYMLVAVVCLILAGVYIYGIFRLDQVNKHVQGSHGMEVSLIQGNIDQSIKWNEKYQRETVNIYEQLSLNNTPVKGSLIIWPETAVPFNFQEKNSLHDQIVNLSLKTGNWLLFGSVSYASHDDEFFNSAYLLSPDGEIAGKYDKVHLVPYGEYVPLRNFFPFINGFTAGIGDFGVGKGYYPLSMGDKKIGVLICYEGILPFAARMYKNRSAELLVNITNDAWFGATSAPFQHFSMAIFRAVETRLYLVRAANTGISGIIDPCGRVTAETNIFQQDALKGYVKFINISTFYAKYGDILVAVCFLMIISFFLMSLKRRAKNTDGKHKYSRNG
ncbi:Apolipoprotein N-acyltransferase / Copper homeostasis protein CutE [Smithella sp. ME-1]|uniref:Apolipoprotein n-acyltransferase / copper homeostasis protein cute n=1 Tax=hydrocarbon metagenome TaxID=938273 RepID=A0A0W8FLL8_9ZZZZ|nr:Apolipoprotein N-acyltransferase / Copper homeostasis protein CutE [Smithella sp. ME-1]